MNIEALAIIIVLIEGLILLKFQFVMTCDGRKFRAGLFVPLKLGN